MVAGALKRDAVTAGLLSNGARLSTTAFLERPWDRASSRPIAVSNQHVRFHFGFCEDGESLREAALAVTDGNPELAGNLVSMMLEIPVRQIDADD